MTIAISQWSRPFSSGFLNGWKSIASSTAHPILPPLDPRSRAYPARAEVDIWGSPPMMALNVWLRAMLMASRYRFI